MSHQLFRENLLRLVALVFLFFASPSAHSEDAYKLKVVTDREDALYEVGEQVRFLVTVTENGKPVTSGTVFYVVDDFITDHPEKTYLRGKLKLGKQAKISAQSSTPGFLRCSVTYKSPGNKKISSVAGAGFSPTKIIPSMPVPDDFDAFWKAQKELLAKVPANPKLDPVQQKNNRLACFDIKLACAGGAPVSGYFSKPKDAKAKSLPAILWLHGAGVGDSSLLSSIKGAKSGMLSLDINAHGILNGQPKEYYQALSKGRLRGYRTKGNDDLEKVYFRGMFLRLIRAMEFLTEQPEWDGKTLIVYGTSQGGGQALAAAGLDKRVTLIVAGVPAICDHSGRVAGRINGWPKLVPLGKDGKSKPKSLQVSRYVDAVNFATRSRADAIMSVGFIDRTCPPSSCYAAYNQLSGKKQMINEPLMGHKAPQHILDAFFKRVLEHIEEQKAK